MVGGRRWGGKTVLCKACPSGRAEGLQFVQDEVIQCRIAGNVCGINFAILFKIDDFAVIIFVILFKISRVPFRREHFAK